MKLAVIIAIIAAAIAGSVYFSSDSEPANGNVNAGPGVTANANPSNAAVHPVSIPGLAEYEPTGRDLKIGRVIDSNMSYTRYFVTYKSDDLTISGVLLIPRGAGPFPVLFLNHGYIDPAVYTNGRGLKREQDYFARRGFAVLHSDYRCHAQSSCPTDDDPLARRLFYAKDVMNAVQAVKVSGEPRLSTEKFGMLGHSMGGGVAQTIIVAKPDLVDAVVLYAPVSSDYRDSYERYTQRRPEEVGRIEQLYGRPDDNTKFWDDLGPRWFFDRIIIPIHIFQGTNDADVPIEWSDKTVELLKAAGRDVTYHVYQDQPHEFTTSWGTFMADSAAFFKRVLQ